MNLRFDLVQCQLFGCKQTHPNHLARLLCQVELLAVIYLEMILLPYLITLTNLNLCPSLCCHPTIIMKEVLYYGSNLVQDSPIFCFQMPSKLNCHQMSKPKSSIKCVAQPSNHHSLL